MTPQEEKQLRFEIWLAEITATLNDVENVLETSINEVKTSTQNTLNLINKPSWMQTTPGSYVV